MDVWYSLFQLLPNSQLIPIIPIPRDVPPLCSRKQQSQDDEQYQSEAIPADEVKEQQQESWPQSLCAVTERYCFVWWDTENVSSLRTMTVSLTEGAVTIDR